MGRATSHQEYRFMIGDNRCSTYALSGNVTSDGARSQLSGVWRHYNCKVMDQESGFYRVELSTEVN
jgi:hypothetical protein